jgi:gas vesicle protein
MNKTIAFVKRLRLARVVIVFLAGIVLFVSTACSNQPSASSKVSSTDLNKADTSSPYRLDKNQDQHLKESYSTKPRQGGMNLHTDTDARRDLSGTEATANKLINRAESNLQRRATNPKEAVDNLKDTASANKVGNNFDNATDRVGQSLKEMKEGAQRGAGNVKENTKNAADDIADQAQKTVPSM